MSRSPRSPQLLELGLETDSFFVEAPTLSRDKLTRIITSGLTDLIVAHHDLEDIDFLAPVPPAANGLAEAISDDLGEHRIPVIYFASDSTSADSEPVFRPLSKQSLAQLKRARRGLIVGGIDTTKAEIEAMLRIPETGGKGFEYYGVMRGDQLSYENLPIDCYWLCEDYAVPALASVLQKTADN